MDAQEHVHSFADTVVSATCQAPGYTLHRCDCGYEYKDSYTMPTPHQFEVQSVTEATCTECGIKELRCSACGTIKTEKIPAKGHAWSDWNAQVLPTCTEEGKQNRICTTCGESETQVIKPTGHRLVNPKKSTTQKGMVEYFCENCGQTVLKKSVGSKLKRWLIFAGVVAVLLLAALLVTNIFFKPVYHTVMAKLYLNLKCYDKSYYQLKDLQRYCERSCENDCSEHEDARNLLRDFYVIKGKIISYDEFDEVTSVTKEKFDEKDNVIIRRIYNEEKELRVTTKIEYNFHGDEVSNISYDADGKQTYKSTYEYSYDKNGNKEYDSYARYDEDGKLEYRYEHAYDADGNQTSYASYDKDGKLKYRYEYGYDEYGNRTSYASYDEDGELSYKSNYKNTYDDNGNIILSEDYDENGKLKGRVEYAYDADGNQTSYASYDEDGELEYRKKYTYDEYGNRTSYASYDKDGKLKCRYEYGYDADGNQTSYASYDEDGELEYRNKYTYDEYGNQTSYARYDKDGELESKTKYQNFEVVYLAKD